jgi:hypothetical protein
MVINLTPNPLSRVQRGGVQMVVWTILCLKKTLEVPSLYTERGFRGEVSS